jgi:hypothetical protein
MVESQRQTDVLLTQEDLCVYVSRCVCGEGRLQKSLQ